MRILKMTAAAVIALGALGLSACASTLDTTVARYQAMPAAQGQSFYVVPTGPMASNGGLEFQRYAGIVAQQLQARGYVPATSQANANLIVQFGYDVDRGQVRITQDPFYGERYGYSPFGSPFYYPRFGFRSAFSYGWNDPFFGGGGIDSYVEYHPQVDLHIRSAGSSQPLFDGRAQARSSTNRLDRVVPSLVEAMFTGFPGRSGEVVRITIPESRPGV
ncbi:MAG: DUF4136 domain-containing protein [Sphingomicrobium sp.]